MTRKIIHCDADCFFAAIEMRDDPSLRHRPMAVGGSPQRRGVISTCNYEARRYGVHSAMPSRTALKLCPDLILVPHRIDKYREAATVMREIFHQYSDRVETVSLDEAYLDVTDSPHFGGSATRIAEAIRAAVAAELSITVSAGVARSKFLAKVASEWRKPDGLYVITPQQEQDFIQALPVKAIPGVGPVTAQRMERLGISHCRDLLLLPLEELVRQFGVFGHRLYQLARGVDEREVRPERVRKSLSVEHTFASDLPDLTHCLERLAELHEEMCQRLAASGKQSAVAKLFIKIRFDDFTTTTLETSGTQPYLDTYHQLLHSGLQRGQRPVRLLGLGVRFVDDGHESEMAQLPLFASLPNLSGAARS